MRYLLDTNVISEVRRGPQSMHPRVKEWIEEIDLTQCCLSVITILELEQGVQLKERSDSKQGKVLRTWLEDYVYPSFKGNVLPITFDIAKKAAELQVPDPAPYYDSLIGGTALVEDCVLVTRNTRDFERFGVALLDPWE